MYLNIPAKFMPACYLSATDHCHVHPRDAIIIPHIRVASLSKCIYFTEINGTHLMLVFLGMFDIWTQPVIAK